MRTEIVSAEQIQSRIIPLRGYRILLDRDLASFYEVPTFRFNEAIRRNENRFPEDFRFQLTYEEFTNLKSQFAMSSGRHRGAAYLPWAFTEHGALMAANVLNSERAVQTSLVIIRAFVALRRMMIDQQALAAKLAELDAKVSAHDEQIAQILEAIRQIVSPSGPEHDRKIGFHRGDR